MEYKKISQVEAKKIMDNEEDIVILVPQTTASWPFLEEFIRGKIFWSRPVL